MNLVYFLMILFNWLFLIGVIFLAGAYVSRIYVTGPSGAEVCFLGGRNKCFGEVVTKYIFLIAVLALLVNAIHFVLHCSIMTETPLREVFSILPVFITKTKYGRFTILKTILLAVIIAVSFVSVLKDHKWTTLSGALFCLLLLFVIAMSGHQGAKGYMNFPFLLDALHLVAVSIWIGGLFFIRFFLVAFVKGAYIQFWQNLTLLINRYSQLATFSVFVAALTGILLSYINVRGFTVLIGSQYGNILMLKILLVGIVVIIGGMNKFFIIPYMNNINPEESSEGLAHISKLLNLVTIEAGLCFVVLLLTSLLTHLSPEG